MAKSRVLVVGTGGIGTVCAYALEHGGLAEVTAVMRSTHDRAVKQGIDIDSVDFGHNIKSWRPTAITRSVPDVSEKDTEPFEFIVVTTKNIPDVPPTVADIIAPAVTPGKTAIVLAQNGVNIEKPLAARFPTNPLISSVVFTGASIFPSGTILHSDTDMQRIGPFSSPLVPAKVAEDAARRYVSLYNPTGNLDITFNADVPAMRWRKLAYNSSFNAVATALQMDTSRIRMCQHLVEELVIPIILEIRAVAAAKGITLQEDLINAVMTQDEPESYFKPSMLQDYEKGNLMEVENLVGEPLREGESLGVSMPTLRIIYNLVKGLQVKIMERKGLWEARYQPDNPYK
ncbi:ketopantoate reductase PanE/ApbA C terminal-domain-containing protein [Aspergillus caelatus]|uniref:2-dehydropantoate 2-reductase n=1 Tax=Aspergillus caelatus TaxID=61420 RepID=A0A5N6ZSS2_9EURO|nr:ketopantoate reductase PanE/ApbA C terminal-domain-containing protein [Aspergillus caelatus]KAE8359956.1 ketopantoate reductase PanE/ApbA C terminal-domain-containing protein [Aspergillus caelatus]